MLLLLLHIIGEVGSPHLPSPTSVCSVFLYTCLAVIEEIYIYIYRERESEREREGRGTEVGVGGGGLGRGPGRGWGGIFEGTVTTLLRFLIALGAVT